MTSNITSNTSTVGLLNHEKANITTAHIVEIWSATFVQTCVCCIGTILNILNFIVFRQNNFTATPYVYMSALAVADAGTLMVYLPTGIIRCDRRISLCVRPLFSKLRTLISYYHTYAGFALGNIFEAISSWITVLICIERYVIMRWTHMGKTHFSRQAAKRQIIYTVCFAILFHFPMFFALEIRRFEKIRENNLPRRYLSMELSWFGSSWYYYTITWIRFLIVQCIPLVVLCVVNLLLLILIWSNYRIQRLHSVQLENGNVIQRKEDLRSSIGEGHSVLAPKSAAGYEADKVEHETYKEERMDSLKVPNFFANRNSQQTLNSSTTVKLVSRLDRSQQANLKLSILLVAVICLFLLGQIPQALAYVHIITVFVPRDCPDCLVYVSLYRHLSHLLCLITSTANFFLYVSLNRHYRKCLKWLLCHTRCQRS